MRPRYHHSALTPLAPPVRRALHVLNCAVAANAAHVPCVGAQADNWVSDCPDAIASACAQCAGCPLLRMCAETALILGPFAGVWAGADAAGYAFLSKVRRAAEARGWGNTSAPAAADVTATLRSA